MHPEERLRNALGKDSTTSGLILPRKDGQDKRGAKRAGATNKKGGKRKNPWERGEEKTLVWSIELSRGGAAVFCTG